MLTREKAIKILDETLCDNCRNCDCRNCVEELLKQQPEQPRRRLINTQAILIKDGDEILILQTFDNGEVYSASFSIYDLSGEQWDLLPTKLPPIPQDGEHDK